MHVCHTICVSLALCDCACSNLGSVSETCKSSVVPVQVRVLADSQALWQKRTAHEAEVRQRRLRFQKEKYEHQLQAAGLWACVCVSLSA